MKRARDQVTGKASQRTSSKSEGPRSFVQTGQNGNGRAKSGRPGRNGGFTLAESLASLSRSDLEDIYRFWEGSKEPETPAADDELRDVLCAWMKDPAVVEERVSELGRRLGSVVEDLLSAPRYQKSWTELASARALAYMTAYDLEACIAALVRRGLVVEGDDRRFENYGERVVGIPLEVGNGLAHRRREKMRGIFGTLTLRGHLEQVYSDPARAVRKSQMTSQRLRELYKMYSQETACVARIDRLPEGVRGLVEKAILEFGGILPRQLFERMETKLPHWNGRRWKMILEQSLVGSVCELSLSRYGIQIQDEVLVVFNEVSLAWLRRVAVPSDPDRPYEELSLGIDLASNISRFLTYIDDNGVRFTVRGEIFKTTEKKILQGLIPNPGRELSREEVLTFIFRFAKHGGLIDRTGKRTFKVTGAGHDWSSLPLGEKQQALLDHALEERTDRGALFHQTRMRRIFMRMLKRIEPGVWYDLMYLPFLARNTYLATLDDLKIDEQFADRAQGDGFPAMEDPQRLAWNLVKWVRHRLYLIGLIDMGYDEARRPVAMRLTQSAARLLGIDGAEGESDHQLGSLVVTPDFEIVLFPTGDDVELIHELDRFCVREKLGSLLHFRVSQETVTRALKNGMGLADMQRVLEVHSRTPVPQNVQFSIRDWSLRGGLMRLNDQLVLTCEEPDVLRAFRRDAGTRKYVSRALDKRSLKLKGRVTPKRMRSLLRELGYIVELGEALS